jgi:hypothetical protein
MPTYEWVCLSCGQDNAPESVACAKCRCPAEATVQQVSECRATHIAGGGTLAPGAGSIDHQDGTALMAILGRFAGLVLGIRT